MPPEQTAQEQTQKPAEQSSTATPAAAASNPNPNSPVRPEGLDDAYWDASKGVSFDKLLPEFSNLRAFKAQRDSVAAQIPEKVEDYEVGLPAGFKVPEGFKYEVDPKDPRLGEARELAKKLGLTKDQFKDLVGFDAQAQIAENDALTKAAGEELAKLGTKGQQRIDAVTNFLQAQLGNELANALLPMMFAAKQIEAFEKLMAGSNVTRFNSVGRETAGRNDISDEDYNRLSPSQRIARAREIARQAKGVLKG